MLYMSSWSSGQHLLWVTIRKPQIQVHVSLQDTKKPSSTCNVVGYSLKCIAKPHQQLSTCRCALSPPSSCQWGSGSPGPASSSRPAASSEPPRPSYPGRSSPLRTASIAGASSGPGCTKVQERYPKPAETQREGLCWRRHWQDTPGGDFRGDDRRVWKRRDS